MPASRSEHFSVAFRPGKKEDRNYILSTWSKGVVGEPPFKWMAKSAWKRHHGVMESLIDGKAKVVVASNPSDEDHILGYAVYDDEAVHWLYVKKKFRGFGLGSELLEIATDGGVGKRPIRYTHYCRYSRAKAGDLMAEYDPLLAYGL